MKNTYIILDIDSQPVMLLTNCENVKKGIEAYIPNYLETHDENSVVVISEGDGEFCVEYRQDEISDHRYYKAFKVNHHDATFDV